jgi:hypothetical protein
VPTSTLTAQERATLISLLERIGDRADDPLEDANSTF